MDFLECLRQHTKDRRLQHKRGTHNGEVYGCTPEQISECEEYGEKAYAEPHPQYLGGRSPHFWICGECLFAMVVLQANSVLCAAHANNVTNPNDTYSWQQT